VNEVIVGVLSKCIAPLSVYCVLTPSLYCAMNNHFCALVLFDYPCGMDHESVANT